MADVNKTLSRNTLEEKVSSFKKRAWLAARQDGSELSKPIIGGV